jgi:hypothetical protein
MLLLLLLLLVVKKNLLASQLELFELIDWRLLSPFPAIEAIQRCVIVVMFVMTSPPPIRIILLF